MAHELIVSKKRIGYDNYHYLIVPDEAAGRKYRYTVYQIPTSPSRKIKVIGLELPLEYARKVVKKHEKSHA